MNGYWITFTDGSHGYCSGSSEYDAKVIAEKMTGKTCCWRAIQRHCCEASAIPGEAYHLAVRPPCAWQVPALLHNTKAVRGWLILPQVLRLFGVRKMNKTLKGMARMICETDNVDGFKCTCPVPFEPDWCLGNRAKKQARAALLWLADNVTDEMLEAAAGRLPHFANLAELDVKDAISAALRAAAGSAPTTPEVK